MTDSVKKTPGAMKGSTKFIISPKLIEPASSLGEKIPMLIDASSVSHAHPYHVLKLFNLLILPFFCPLPLLGFPMKFAQFSMCLHDSFYSWCNFFTFLLISPLYNLAPLILFAVIPSLILTWIGLDSLDDFFFEDSFLETNCPYLPYKNSSSSLEDFTVNISMKFYTLIIH